MSDSDSSPIAATSSGAYAVNHASAAPVVNRSLPAGPPLISPLGQSPDLLVPSKSVLALFHESIAIIIAAFVGLIGAAVGGLVVLYSTNHAAVMQRDQAKFDHQADVYADYLSKETEAVRLYNILYAFLTSGSGVSDADIAATFPKMSDAWSEAGKSAWLVMLVDDSELDALRAKIANNEQTIPDALYQLRSARSGNGVPLASTQAARDLRRIIDTQASLLEEFTKAASEKINPR